MPFYHQPHPWDPGYAIPKYVLAEPPERGTFTTQWLPRGTISQVIPDYLAKPGRTLLGRNDAGLQGLGATRVRRPRTARGVIGGFLQGIFGTRPGRGAIAGLGSTPTRRIGRRSRPNESVQATGSLGSLGGCTLAGDTLAGSSLAGTSLSGDTLGAQTYELEPLGATTGYSKYGRDAARKMIAHVKRLPPQHRAKAMKDAMRRIDPTLQARAERHALNARARGVSNGQALELGIATAMTEGVLGELTRIGKSRRAPQPNSLLGLGCDRARQSALGALIASGKATGISFPPPAGFTWDAAAGVLRRLRVGEQVTRCPAECAVDVRTHPDAGPATGPSAGERAEQAKKSYIQIGPTTMVMVPADTADGARVVIHSPMSIPSEWIPILRGAFTTPADAANPRDMVVPPVKGADAAWDQYVLPWLAVLGIPSGTPLNYDRLAARNFSFVFKHPVDGKDWGLMTYLGSGEGTNKYGHVWPLPGTKEATKGFPEVLVFGVIKVPEPGWFARLMASLNDVVSGIVDAVGEATCALLTQPGAIAGATKVNPAAGTGAAIVASQMCQPPSAPPPPLLPQSSSILPWLLLAGVGIVGVVLVTKDQ